MNSSLKLFTQADLLLQLDAAALQDLLGRFSHSDPELAPLALGNPYFHSQLARAFTQTPALSPQLLNTLLLLESAASPENHERLCAITQHHLPNLSHTEFHPLALALELWLAFPDELVGMCCAPTLRSDCRRRGNETLTEDSQFIPPHSTDAAQRVPTACEKLPSDIENPAPDHSPFQSSNIPSFHPQQSTNPESCIQHPACSPLLASLRSLLARYVILPPHAAEALALWIIHTYAFELRDVTTYLALESPVRRCGKTTLLNLLSRLVNRPLVAANVSPSALYRAIQELRPTLIIDEADTFLKPNDPHIGILNAGYHRATAYVLRVSSERSSRRRRRGNQTLTEDSQFIPPHSTDAAQHVPTSSRLERFSCWCPKILARIGRLPETLADRCIVIPMQRKTPNDQCERFRDLDTVAVCKELRQDCAQFVQDHRDAIASAKPAIPASLNDRAADIWEPLLAIADCAGGDWPTLAREAAVALSSDTRENNPIGSLLLDIFLLFNGSEEDRILTRDIVEALNTQFTDRPWMENRTQRSTEIWLSKQLRPFGICPRMFRNEGSVVRGYLRKDFEEVFRRYVPGDLSGRGNDLTGGNRDNGG